MSRNRRSDSHKKYRKLRILAKVAFVVLLVCSGVIGAWKMGVFSEKVNERFEFVADHVFNMNNKIMDMSIGEISNSVSLRIRELWNSIQKTVDILEPKPKNIYGNYSFGLVKTSDGVIVDSYGRYVVLINNRNSKNLSYDQLLKFLKNDNTDEYFYQRDIIRLVQPYSGTAESNVDLTLWKGIVDGTEDMAIPRICADFAYRLHNTAEMVGIRCGYVSIELTGYSDPYNLGISADTGHALNVFNTTDKGLIFIDCTGGLGGGPSSYDKIISTLQVGNNYIPESLFPESGWKSTWGNVGEVTSIYVTWDGDWDS